MKEILVFLICLVTVSFFGQNLSVKVIYNQASSDKRITKSDEVKIFKNLEYKLICSETASKFKIIEKMDSDSFVTNERFAARISSISLYYKNLLKKEKLVYSNFFGNNYIVKHPF